MPMKTGPKPIVQNGKNTTIHLGDVERAIIKAEIKRRDDVNTQSDLFRAMLHESPSGKASKK